MRVFVRLAYATLLLVCWNISAASQVWCERSKSTVDESLCQPQPSWVEVGTAGLLGFTRYLDTKSISKFGPLVKYTVKFTNITDKFLGEKKPKTIFARCENKDRAEAETADLAYRSFAPAAAGSTDALEVDLVCSMASRAELIKDTGKAKDIQGSSSQQGNTVIARYNSINSDLDGMSASSATAQSQLPVCQGDDGTQWSSCFGQITRTGHTYEGVFMNGKEHGFGTMNIFHPDHKGNKYVGEFKYGKPNGQGTFYHLADNRWKGYKHVGEFKDGKPNGNGTLTYANGDIHVGEFKDGKKDGQGTHFRADGRIGLGDWVDGKPSGRFIEYRADKSIERSGTFSDGKLVTSQYVDPNSFIRIARTDTAPVVTEPKSLISESISNLPPCPASDWTKWSNCFGSWTGLSGDKYVGEFNNGKFNGQGTTIFPNGSKYIGEWKDDAFSGQGTLISSKGKKYVGEFKDNNKNGKGIIYSANGNVEESGNYKDDKLVTSQYVDPNSFIRIARTDTAPVVSENLRLETNRIKNELEKERQRLAEEKRRFEAEKAQREEEKKSSRIVIKSSASQPDANGDFTITIQTGTDTASLKIDGEELGGKRDGNYVIKRVARVSEDNSHTITARDVFGNSDTKTISVSRKAVDSRPSFARLNPANIKPQPARDAVAIIIGIQNYKLIPKAEYASQDAQVFYDYASRALGIKQENIKLLLDDEADVSGILTAFQNWLPLKVRKGKTDVYVFYSGHGLPSPDGKSLFFLPVGANKDFVAKTAISQQEIVAGLKAAQPKSVTMFIDSCYSGQIRTGETLLASARPVVLTVQDTAYPPEFTVITASASDQIASSSPDLKHGIFSYYLMKGLEGEADDKGDGTITIGKLQSYLAERVPRFAMTMSRKQEPQLTGDANRVLVAR
jgi:hypothetical protein